MSSPEERPSFKDPSSPIGRVQSGLAASFLFESGNNEQANLPNNNINKGRWTDEEHKIFNLEEPISSGYPAHLGLIRSSVYHSVRKG